LSKRTGLLTIFEGITTNELDAMKQPKQIPGAERARVAFHQGRLVYASAADQDSSLVAVLNKAGKLNNEQARQLRERMGALGDKGLAMRLIGAKYVTQGDILAAVKQNILDIVFNLMTIQEGPFRFDDNLSPGNDVILVPIELEPVIIEGGRRIKEATELDKIIGSLDVSLKFAENAKQKFKGVHLTVDEWKIVPYIDPKNTLRQIMKVVNMSELQIKRIVYSLNQAGLIEIVNVVKPPVAPQRPNRPTKPPAAPEKRVVLSIIEKLKSM
ncbi:MAG: DUF4388 domain-containing protein, partial [Aggregatilineales bacterium]